MSAAGPESGAREFARRREVRHRSTRRRTALAGAVLVLVGAVAAGVLVAYGLGDDEAERDADGRLVPPSGLGARLQLEPDAARDLVAEGTWPGDDELDGMPTDDVGRIGWLLSAVAWSDQDAEAVGVGLLEAADEDEDFVTDVVSGVASASKPLLPALRDDVMLVLQPRNQAVAAALAGDEPAPGEPGFEDGGLLATFAAVGHEDAGPLEDPLVDAMAPGWATAFPASGRDDAGAAQRFGTKYAEQFRRSVQPVVLLYVGLAEPLCGDGVDATCRAEVTRWTERADTLFADAVLDSIPRKLLPPAVDRALGADTAAHRRLPPAAAREWERFRVKQGYGVLRPVLDALAS